MLMSSLPISSVCRHSPLLASQILTVMSHDADASRAESCEKATELTELRWPSSVCRHSPLLASQILTVLSPDADASRADSCEKAIDLTESRWPSSVCRHSRLLASQILTVLSHDTSDVRIILISGLFWCQHCSVYLTGVHVMGVYLIGMHVMGVYIMDVHLMCISWGYTSWAGGVIEASGNV
jgi:hypothetical protein